MGDAISSKQVLATSVREVDTPAVKAVRDDPEAFAFLLKMFDSTIGMVSGSRGDIAIGIINKGLAVTDIVSKHSQAPTVQAGPNGVTLTSTTIQILLTTASLTSLAGKVHPGAAIATITAAFATKTSLALGLAGGDDKKAACIAAVADLAAAGATLAAGAITTGTGVGAVTGIGPLIIASSIASLILAGHKLHLACAK